MKRYLYYITPFMFIEIVSLLCSHLDNISLYFIMLLLICILIGSISPTNKNFDYVITLITPLTFLGILFLRGFLESDCSGIPTFSLDEAFETAFQPSALIAYCVMALTTFLASFKPIRITKLLNGTKHKMN